MSDLFDVVIVGTGPGGNSAAIVCARAGLSVLLVEKESLPRRKVCGGGLSQKALRALPVPAELVVERWIDSGWLCRGPERAVFRTLERPGAMVSRETFDHYMTKEACRAGAALWDRCAFVDCEREGDTLLVTTARGPVRARVLVGADGVHSRVRARTFPERNVDAAAAVEVLVKPRAGVLAAIGSGCVFDFGALEGGYGWIFPKSDHLNVGLYRFRRTAGNADLKGRLARFVASNAWLRGGDAGDARGYMIPVRPVAAPLARGRVLLVGDAAGMAEALFGEGISFAVRSGCEAGRAIVDHVRAGAPLDDYLRRLAPLRRDLYFARLTARGFYGLPAFGFERMVRSPFLSGLFSGTITGDVSPAACAVGTIASAPWWLLTPRTLTAPLPAA